MTSPLTVTVLGSGTSAGIPVVACDCVVCQSTDTRNQRLRSSILLRSAEAAVVVDCGSDFRQQALTHRIDRLDAVLLTHAHSDHVAGLDELRLYNWKQKKAMPLFGSGETLNSLRRRFDYAFEPLQAGGGVPQLDLITIGTNLFEAAGLSILPLHIMHGILPVTGFRIGDFAYITDASLVPPETIDRIRGVKTLILNALRHRPHPTHLSVDEAVAVAREVGAERTYFTHINHELDHEETNRNLPPGIELSWDGLEFLIDPEAW